MRRENATSVHNIDSAEPHLHGWSLSLMDSGHADGDVHALVEQGAID